jgi:hypothetical protein
MRIVAPPPLLAPFVRDFMVVENETESARLRLPEPGFVLGVRFAGSAAIAGARLPDVVLTGMQTAARTIATAPRSGLVLTRFAPGGAARFFSQPLHRLLGQTVALGDLVALRDVDRLHARVAEAPGDRDRVDVVADFLRTRMLGRDDALVAAAVRRIE